MMKIWKKIILALAFTGLALNAQAAEGLTEVQARELVQPFYDLLSRKASVDEASANIHKPLEILLFEATVIQDTGPDHGFSYRSPGQDGAGPEVGDR